MNINDVFTEAPSLYPAEPERELSEEDKKLRTRVIDFFYQKEQDYDEGFKVGPEYLICSYNPDEEHENFITGVIEFVKKEKVNETKT